MASRLKKRILVVDDDTGFAQVVKYALEDTGAYNVRIESEAMGAIAIARDYRPDLILLDLVLPGLQGGEVASLFHDDAALTDVPVVILTATLPRQSDESPERALGGRPFLSKPVGLEDLIRCIEGHTSGRFGSQSVSQ